MGKDLKSLFWTLLLAASAVAGSLAQAAPISWQTEPVLGYSSTQGAGPGFNSGSGNWISSVYVATGNGVITIPQYSIPGDIFFGVGGPSVPTFTNGPALVVWDAAAVNYTAGNTYLIAERWDYLGGSPFTPGTHNFRLVGNLATPLFIDAGTYTDPSHTGIVFWHSDNLPFLNTPDLPSGPYQYTLRWTNASNPLDTISYTRAFTIAPIPEPETYAMMLAGLGLIGFVARRRKSRLVA